jgi:hypothetical protein
MKLETLKARLEERNNINFRYEFYDDKDNSTKLYYLKTQPGKDGRSIEIHTDRTAGNRETLFNVYGLNSDGEADHVYIRCYAERVEDILRQSLGVTRRQKQERLL